VVKGGIMIVVAGALSFGAGTGASNLDRSDVQRATRVGWTTSGVANRARRGTGEMRLRDDSASPDLNPIAPPPGEDTARLVLDLRRRSGLTWDQLASIFGVDRRSVHFWASGRAMNANNAERLARVLAAVARADRGDPSVTRAWLLTPTRDGRIPLDLLRQDDLSAFGAEGVGAVPPVKRAPSISANAAAARAPRPPQELLDANQDPVPGAPARLIRSTRLTPKKLS
jgi:hypothetical protein